MNTFKQPLLCNFQAHVDTYLGFPWLLEHAVTHLASSNEEVSKVSQLCTYYTHVNIFSSSKGTASLSW